MVLNAKEVTSGASQNGQVRRCGSEDGYRNGANRGVDEFQPQGNVNLRETGSVASKPSAKEKALAALETLFLNDNHYKKKLLMLLTDYRHTSTNGSNGYELLSKSEAFAAEYSELIGQFLLEHPKSMFYLGSRKMSQGDFKERFLYLLAGEHILPKFDQIESSALPLGWKSVLMFRDAHRALQLSIAKSCNFRSPHSAAVRNDANYKPFQPPLSKVGKYLDEYDVAGNSDSNSSDVEMINTDEKPETSIYIQTYYGCYHVTRNFDPESEFAGEMTKFRKATPIEVRLNNVIERSSFDEQQNLELEQPNNLHPYLKELSELSDSPLMQRAQEIAAGILSNQAIDLSGLSLHQLTNLSRDELFSNPNSVFNFDLLISSGSDYPGFTGSFKAALEGLMTRARPDFPGDILAAKIAANAWICIMEIVRILSLYKRHGVSNDSELEPLVGNGIRLWMKNLKRRRARQQFHNHTVKSLLPYFQMRSQLFQPEELD